MPLEALEPFSVIQANEVVGSNALLDGDLGEGLFCRRCNGSASAGALPLRMARVDFRSAVNSAMGTVLFET